MNKPANQTFTGAAAGNGLALRRDEKLLIFSDIRAISRNPGQFELFREDDLFALVLCHLQGHHIFFLSDDDGSENIKFPLRFFLSNMLKDKGIESEERRKEITDAGHNSFVKILREPDFKSGLDCLTPDILITSQAETFAGWGISPRFHIGPGTADCRAFVEGVIANEGLDKSLKYYREAAGSAAKVDDGAPRLDGDQQ